jgi:hypothetical protein
VALFPWLAGFGLAGRLVRGGSEARVAPASATGFGGGPPLPGSIEIPEYFPRLVVHYRTHGHRHGHIFAVLAMAVGTFAVVATLGPEFPGVPKLQQGV